MKSRRKKPAKPMNEEPFTVVEIEDLETVCHVCFAEFLDEEDLKLHVTQVHLNESNGKTICKICCKVLPAADAFVSHFIFKHLENTSFCFYCYRVFTEASHLEQHELKHCVLTDESTISCSQCFSLFPNRLELQSHEYEEHQTDEGFMLNDFFSLLSSALNIEVRKFIDSLCKQNPFICRKCKHISLSLKNFIEHLKTKKCQSYACDKCLNVYKQKNSVSNHMLQKLECNHCYVEKVFKELCSKCDEYIDCKELSAHVEVCNIAKCSMCKKTFNSIYELIDHRTKEHRLSISLETCKFCKRQFVGTLSLKKHYKRSHKNKRLYKYNCVHCDSMFNHPRKLFGHFFTRHKDIEPFTCKICNKSFRLRKQFTIHIKLEHKSVGFVEFEENMHVIFTDKKSESPVETAAYVNMDSTTDASDSDCNEPSQEKDTATNTEQESNDKDNLKSDENNITETMVITISPDKNNVDTNKNIDLTQFNADVKLTPQITRKRKSTIPSSALESESDNNLDKFSDNSDEEPLSTIKESLLRRKNNNTSNTLTRKRRMANRNKREKLTCKICSKYCYTVQNFHHHLTLHEKSKLKRCIKCNNYFKSRKELESHVATSHSSSKLIETLKSVLEKRKRPQSIQNPGKPAESLTSILERRKKQHKDVQDSDAAKFRKTIKKVEIIDHCKATLTPVTDDGLSVKNFIENFKPDADSVNISNSVTIKALKTPMVKETSIKMHKLGLELPQESFPKLKFPVKFKESPTSHIESKVTVKLVQKLVTKPKKINMTYKEQIPTVENKPESSQYCNMFADETDYTQYKHDPIPEVAQEVMLEDLEDIPRTKRLAQEIIIPKIPEEHGEVRIGHLLPQAPFYKIVKVNKLIKTKDPPNAVEEAARNVQLPDGTRLVSVKNPYPHLIPNEHLEEVLKAHKNIYYKPKNKNIAKAIAKALIQVKPRAGKRGRKKTKV